MNLEVILKDEIAKNHAQFLNAPKNTQKILVKKLIKEAVSTSLKTIKLPPLKDAFQQRIDEYKYNRRNQQYRRKHKLPNYELLERLYKIQNKDVKTDRTDFFLQRIKIDYASLGKRIMDLVSNTERKTHISYGNYSKNQLPKESCFFKFYEIDQTIFESEKGTRNEITRFKYKLLDPIHKSLLISEKTNMKTIQSADSIKQGFTENLFVLYDLQSFLNFVNVLEERSKTDIVLNDTKNYAFDVLKEYYFEIFKSHGHPITKENTMEYILENDEFRILSEENPLTQGFTMLLANSIQIPDIIELIENEHC